jgi:hypothetical protein
MTIISIAIVIFKNLLSMPICAQNDILAFQAYLGRPVLHFLIQNSKSLADEKFWR